MSTIQMLEEFSNIGIHEWKTALTEENLRGNQLWRLVPPLPSGDRTILSHMMSEAPRAPVTKSVIEKLRRLQKEVDQSKTQERPSAAPVPMPAPTRVAKTAKKKRPVVEDVYAIEDRGICLTFPPEAHAYSEFSPCLEESKKLLFPSDRNMFDQIGSNAVGEVGVANAIKTVQSLLYQNKTAKKLHDRVKQLEHELVELQSEIDTLKADLAKSDALATDRLKARDLEAGRHRSTSLELDRVRGQLELAWKENEIVAFKTQVSVTADLLRQFQSGKSDWDFDEVYASEREMQVSYSEASTVRPSGEMEEFDDTFSFLFFWIPYWQFWRR